MPETLPQPIPCNGRLIQPPCPPGFGGTAPCRCQGFGIGPHVWIEGESESFACKVCGEAGEGCPSCGETGSDGACRCAHCCGEGVIPLGFTDSYDDDGDDPPPPLPFFAQGHD